MLYNQLTHGLSQWSQARMRFAAGLGPMLERVGHRRNDETLAVCRPPAAWAWDKCFSLPASPPWQDRMIYQAI